MILSKRETLLKVGFYRVVNFGSLILQKIWAPFSIPFPPPETPPVTPAWKCLKLLFKWLFNYSHINHSILVPFPKESVV